MATSPQRAYRAACPNCGAPVAFASAASASAVCSFCKSTLVRDGEALRRIGVQGELFDDHSPLQLQATGRWQGEPFTLVGRLQYGSDDGTWNEWHALFDNGKSGWLSEDNGAYVIAFDAPLDGAAPAPEALAPGGIVQVGGRGWTVASRVRARLLAAEGELPRPPRSDGQPFDVVDLRSQWDEVATLDWQDPSQPVYATGRPARLAELAMQGLRDVAEKSLGAGALACPSCGAALEVRLASTQSITCGQCKAVVDISQGVGKDLAHYQQNNSGPGGLQPQIPLGTSGQLALGGLPLAWQVVGYMERCDLPTDADEDQTYWREYLLYEPKEGFAFLVDAEDGWSWVRPLTGVPQGAGERVQWQGDAYRKRYSYTAKVTWVLGEFYWRVRREERALVTDYDGEGSARQKRLSREQTGQEITWSGGAALDAREVARAFGLGAEAGERMARNMARDVGPVASLEDAGGLVKPVLIFIVLVLMIIAVGQCSGDDCGELRATYGEASAEYQQCLRSQRVGGARTGGGSWGGFSSGGGGHK